MTMYVTLTLPCKKLRLSFIVYRIVFEIYCNIVEKKEMKMFINTLQP